MPGGQPQRRQRPILGPQNNDQTILRADVRRQVDVPEGLRLILSAAIIAYNPCTSNILFYLFWSCWPCKETASLSIFPGEATSTSTSPTHTRPASPTPNLNRVRIQAAMAEVPPAIQAVLLSQFKTLLPLTTPHRLM